MPHLIQVDVSECDGNGRTYGRREDKTIFRVYFEGVSKKMLNINSTRIVSPSNRPNNTWQAPSSNRPHIASWLGRMFQVRMCVRAWYREFMNCLDGLLVGWLAKCPVWSRHMLECDHYWF